MKKLLIFTLFVAAMLTTGITNSYSQSGLGFYVGLSTPNDKIKQVYNNQNLSINNQNWLMNLFQKGSDVGYNIGVKLRFPVSSNFVFQGGIAWNRFPKATLKIQNPDATNGQPSEVVLSATSNIIPISLGANLYLLRSIISAYGTGEVTYNYMTSSIDYQTMGVNLPISTNPSYNRVGFGLGAGLDLDLKILLLNLEAKYNMANLIGQTAGEEAKTYWTLTLGVYFGGLMPL